MPDLLQITDGATVLDLNLSSGGFTTESVTLPRVQRQTTRVSGFPFSNGSRTVASGLADTQIEWIGLLQSSSVNAVHALFQSLVTLLEKAQRWEEQRIGSPVRFAYKRAGAQNIAYWVITGASPPEPAGQPSQWMSDEMRARTLRIRMVLTLEPIAHADTVTQIISTTLTVQPGLDRIASAIAPVGDMPGPIMVSLENTSSGTTWASVWLALLEGNPVNQIWNNIADATAYQGRQDFAITTTISTLYSVNYVPTSELPLRVLLRCYPHNGIWVDVQVRAVMTIGATVIAGEWVSFPTAFTTSSWALMDLGTLLFPRDFFKRASQSDTSPVSISVQARTTGGFADLASDYAQILTYRSFVRLDALVPYNSVLKYDALLRDTTVGGSFYWPARNPQTYVVNSAAELTQAARREGKLGQVTPGITTRIWWSATSATDHLWGATASVVVHYLPSFSLGLRGSV